MTPMHTQYVQVGERRVFVRHAGRGPALVLLHQSPQSGHALEGMLHSLADRYAVFVPDTPGFGHSDPLPRAQPTIPDLAEALSALLRALRLGPVLLYGVHTGANIAARLALDHPEQVAGLVCDGLALFNCEERQPLLDGYLPPFEPLWDGTHLLWLWARLREQYLFFPWHQPTAAARLAYPLFTPEALHSNAMDLLAAGDGYRNGYRAPLLYEDGARGAQQLQVPAALLYRKTDVLRPHMQRLGALPAGVSAHEAADPAGVLEQAQLFWSRQAAHAATVDSLDVVRAGASTRTRLFQGGVGTARAVGAAGASGALVFHVQGHSGDEGLLCLGDIGQPAALPGDCAATRRAWAMEWPGHGASHGWVAAEFTLDALADAVLQALARLAPAGEVPHLAVRAHGGSGALAVLLAQRLGARCSGLELINPLPLRPDEAECFLAQLPDGTPHATGAHLIAAWNWARQKSLFWPWMPPSAEACIAAAAPAPRQVHAQVVEMLRAGPMFAALWRASLHAPMAAALAPLRLSLGPRLRISVGSHPQQQALGARLAAGAQAASASPHAPA